MTNPNVSIRINPKRLDLLKKLTGEKKTATAIKIAIDSYIRNNSLPILQIDLPKMITVDDAAKLLKINRSNVYRRIYKGHLKAVQTGGIKSKWLIYLDSVNTLIKTFRDSEYLPGIDIWVNQLEVDKNNDSNELLTNNSQKTYNNIDDKKRQGGKFND